MKTTAIDLEFTCLPYKKSITIESLMSLVDDIHNQWVAFMSGEEDMSGWSSDAGYGSLSMILPRFSHFIAVEGSDLVFGFGNQSSRDCVLTDYIGTADDTELPENVAPESVGSAMIPRRNPAKKEV